MQWQISKRVQLCRAFTKPFGCVVCGLLHADRCRLSVGEHQDLHAGRIDLPQTQRGMRHDENIAQQMGNHVLQGGQLARGKQRGGEFMHLVLQSIVCLGEFQQFVQPPLQPLILFTQRQQLAFAQRYGASAVRMSQRDLRQRFDMLLEECRRID